MNTERRQESRCRLLQDTFALGFLIAPWSCPWGNCLCWINAFPTMLRRRKIALCCSPCRGLAKMLEFVRLIDGRKCDVSNILEGWTRSRGCAHITLPNWVLVG